MTLLYLKDYYASFTRSYSSLCHLFKENFVTFFLILFLLTKITFGVGITVIVGTKLALHLIIYVQVSTLVAVIFYLIFMNLDGMFYILKNVKFMSSNLGALKGVQRSIRVGFWPKPTI